MNYAYLVKKLLKVSIGLASSTANSGAAAAHPVRGPSHNSAWLSLSCTNSILWNNIYNYSEFHLQHSRTQWHFSYSQNRISNNIKLIFSENIRKKVFTCKNTLADIATESTNRDQINRQTHKQSFKESWALKYDSNRP